MHMWKNTCDMGGGIVNQDEYWKLVQMVDDLHSAEIITYSELKKMYEKISLIGYTHDLEE